MENLSSNHGFEYLDGLIHSGAKEVRLESDIDLDSLPVKIDVDDLVIDGADHTIDAHGKTQIFRITAKNVVLKNITFKNAQSRKSGAAISNFKHNLTLVNCRFINNVSFEGDGGAIYNWKGFMTIEGCDFIANASGLGGGAVCNGNVMEIMDCSFSDNDSNGYGSSIFNKAGSVLTLRNSDFKGDGEFIIQDDHLNSEIFNRGIVNIEESEKNELNKFLRHGFVHIFSDGAKSFRHLKNLIAKGGRIGLDFDIDFADEDEALEIDVDGLVIDGNGHTIDALAKRGIFTVASQNVTFKNITFRNANSRYGGLSVKKNASLNLVNCRFENNLGEAGGAINNDGLLDVQDCRFSNNASKGDFGGAIRNKGDLTLKRTYFNNNISLNCGGAISNCGHVHLDECSFKSNVAEDGGAIGNVSEGLVKAIKCAFEGNMAFSHGGIIFNDNYFIAKGCEFSGNASNNGCHAIHHRGDEDSELLIENCDFYHRLSDENLIYLEEGFCRIHSSRFDVNDDSYMIRNINADLRFEKPRFINMNRKAVFNEGILNIRKEDRLEDKITLASNSSVLNYLGQKVPEGWKGFTYLDNLIHSGSMHVRLDCDILIHFSEQDFYESGIEVNVDGLVIDGNFHTVDANNFSRIFIISGENVVIKNIMFRNGKYFKGKYDEANAGGGAIYAMPESSVEISQCIFSENKSRQSAGAILNKSQSLKMDSIKFEKNRARNKGGAILSEGSSVDVHDCDFIGNSADCSGAAHNEDGRLDMSNVIFNGNSAERCGAISNHYSDLSLSACKFINNRSAGPAGAVFNHGGFCRFDDCDFVKNDSAGSGTAIFNEYGQVTMDDSRFLKNSSNEDGGSIFDINGCFNLTGCIFNRNSALNRGGAIENYRNSRFCLTDCSFSKNSANDGGAISNLKKCKLTIKGCSFEDNASLKNGGVLYNWYGFVGIENSNFTGNESEYAGAIDNYLGWLNLKKSLFKDNNAKKYGGALFNGGMLESLEDCIFEDNQCLLKGGAIYTTKSSSGNILNSRFSSNRANGNGGLGGAIYNGSFSNGTEEFSLDVTDCDFTDNFANDDGGAIFNKGHLNLNTCDFKDNLSAIMGRALANEGNDVEYSEENTNFYNEF